jgi:hypothetical protein
MGKEKQQMTHDEIVQKINDLSDMIQLVDDTVKFNIGTMWAVIGTAMAIIGGALYFLVRNMINDKINKEIDKRLLDLLRDNQPVFFASGVATPDINKKIYLSSNIKGIDQLVPEKVLILEVYPENQTFISLESGLIPTIRVNEQGIVEIEIPNYDVNNGNVTWKLLWPRTQYTR